MVKKQKETIETKAEGIAEEASVQTDNIVFALDIGTRTVVGVIGEADPDSGDNFIVRDCVSVPHPKRAMIDGQIEDIKQVSKIVKEVKEKLEKSTGLKLTHVSIAAAGRALKTRRVSADYDISEMESVTADMIKSMEVEAIQRAQSELTGDGVFTNLPYYCVGHSVVKYLLDDYKIISLEGHKGEKATVELIATFLPNIVVEGLYSVMDRNGLEVSSLTLEPIAAMNAIIPPELRLINIALVDIGAGTSDIAVSDDGSIVAYAMATTAGDEITEEIIKTYFVDFNTAEEIKRVCCAGEDYEYTDIFGNKRLLTPNEFAEKIEPSVDVLAETICENIIEANSGNSPSAVFLIGGGSLVAGLPEMVAEKLGLDLSRVAIGGHEKLRNIDTGGRKLGAEYVTPLGIAITGIINRGYDFSVITLNDKAVRIFDTKQISVYELLTTAGYKSADIMGRSGHNLTYLLNGKRVILRGGGYEPARVAIGGENVSLSARVSNGDKVTFKPAVCGENAKAVITDIVNFGKYNRGYVEYDGQKYETGVDVRVNGKPVKQDYVVQNLDEIEAYGILTLDDLAAHLGLMGAELLINGYREAGNYLLKDGDLAVYRAREDTTGQAQVLSPQGTPPQGLQPQLRQEQPAYAVRGSVPDVSGLPSANSFSAETETLNTGYGEEVWGVISVTLNGRKLTLPPNDTRMPHAFLELLNYSELDFDNPKGAYVMLINNEQANFNDIINNGDDCVLKWAED